MMFADPFSAYINLIERIIELLEGRRKRRQVLRSPVEETLKKVEAAQAHLTDAVEAIDIVRTQVVAERSKLDSLLEEVEEKREQYNEASADLKTAQDLLSQDREKLRAALGVNPKRDRVIGFVSGVIASMLATAIWVSGSKLWSWVLSLVERGA